MASLGALRKKVSAAIISTQSEPIMSTTLTSSGLRSLLYRRCTFSSRFGLKLHRHFSSTVPNSIRAVFTETDNAELNDVLKSIQETIILPAHLPDKQRKIVFNPDKRSYLEQNPVVIEVDGLEHKFSPINRFEDIENSKKALSKALGHMHTADDWANLSTLLAGFKKAGIRLKSNHLGKIVRLAGEKGQVYTIIECAKQSEKTGLHLKHPEVLVRVLMHVNDKISNSSGQADETKQAVKWMEIVLDLLQRPEHVSKVSKKTRERLHYARLVRGMVLYARVAAVKIDTAAERDSDLLKDEVALLTSLWEDAVDKDLFQVTEFANLNPLLERNAKDKGNYIPQVLNGSAYIRVLGQNIKGIEIAQQILGEDAQGLSPILKTLKSHLRDFATKSVARTNSWAEEYEKILGKMDDWPGVSNEAVDA